MKILNRKKVATPPSKYKHTGILRAFSFFILLFSIASLATVFLFLEQNLNAAITEVEGLVELNKQGIVEIIDFTRLEKIVSYMEKKNLSITPVTQDPFNNIDIPIDNNTSKTPTQTQEKVTETTQLPVQKIDPIENLSQSNTEEVSKESNNTILNIPDSAVFQSAL